VLSGVTVVVVDLPGSALGAMAGNVLMVDSNAAGYGWFVDATPGSDSEFGRVVSASERRAGASSAAYGRADLLTVMMHELGHRMGMDHSDAPGNIMQDEIGLGTRRLPTVWDAALAEWMYSTRPRRAA
jgi:hypothetical protein